MLSRKLSGSKNRKKAKRILVKWHEHIVNKRRNFLWNLANEYTDNYGTIKMPKLPLKEEIMHATTSRKAMKLCDASFGILNNMIIQKAEDKGVKIEEYEQNTKQPVQDCVA